MKANDQCNRCGIDRDVHDLRPAPDHAFVEPPWCPTCLKSGIYTASCEHMKPDPQPAPTLSTFNQVLAALRNPSVDLGDLDVCRTCLSVESPYLHSAGTACPTGPTVDVPQPVPSGAVSFCPHGTPFCAACLGNVNEDDEPAPSGDEAKVRELARAEAESIATRWVPAHMTARQGMVDDITASLVRYRQLGQDDARRGSEGT